MVDARANVLTPVWRGEEAFQESVMVVANEDGSVSPISLLHPATEILEVRSLYLGITYTDGKDYLLDENGRLLVFAEGSIPITTHQEVYLDEEIQGKSFQTFDGGFLYFSEDGFFHKRQIAVTYRHKEEWFGTIPKRKGNIFEKTNVKLEGGHPLKVLFYGDSITVGLNASGVLDLPPHLPSFSQLVVEAWKKTYQHGEISAINTAVCGKNSFWAVEEAKERIGKYASDLLVLGFGMNDGKTEPDEYSKNIRFLIEQAKYANPACEIVLIAPMLPNKELVKFWGNQRKFLPELEHLARQYEGVGVADMTTMHGDLLKRKRFLDMTGNHVNHTNDYLTRVYAQVILETIKR